MTVTPWTLAKRRRKATSLATPFCRHTIGVDGGATAANDSITPVVSWLLTATTTTSSGPNVSSAGEPTTGTGRVTEPSGHSTVRPPSAMASRWAPRATSTTSWPNWNSRPPTTPPTAPGPTSTIRMSGGDRKLAQVLGDLSGELDHARRDGRQRAVLAPHHADLAGRQLRRHEPHVDALIARVDGEQRHHGPAHSGPHHRHLGAVVVGPEHERRRRADDLQPALDVGLAAARRVTDQRDVIEVAGRERAIGQLTSRRHEDERVVEQQHRLEVAAAVADREGELELTGEHGLGAGVVVLLLEEADVDPGVLTAQLLDHRRQQHVGHALEGPDVDAPDGPGEEALDRLTGRIEPGDDVAGVAEDDLAERCQLDRARSAGAIEDGAAHEPLEGGDLLADGRLGVPEPQRRLAEGALRGHRVDGDEVPHLEIAQLHEHQSS